MLILTRREGESVQIGYDIEVTVLAVRGGQVRVGIDAPQDIAILRGELSDREQQQTTRLCSLPS